jgi:hypothetical protein
MADAVLLVVSDAARWIAGQYIVARGGIITAYLDPRVAAMVKLGSSLGEGLPEDPEVSSFGHQLRMAGRRVHDGLVSLAPFAVLVVFGLWLNLFSSTLIIT